MNPQSDPPVSAVEQSSVEPTATLPDLLFALCGNRPPLTAEESTAALWDDLVNRASKAFSLTKGTVQAIAINSYGSSQGDEAIAIARAINMAEREALAFACSEPVRKRLNLISEHVRQNDESRLAVELGHLLEEMIGRADAVLQASQPLLLNALRQRWPVPSGGLAVQPMSGDQAEAASPPAGRGNKKSVTKEQASESAERLSCNDPGFKHLPLREMAKRMSPRPSISTLHSTKFYQKVKLDQTHRDRSQRSTGRTVQLSPDFVIQTADASKAHDSLVSDENEKQVIDAVLESGMPKEAKQELIEKIRSGLPLADVYHIVAMYPAKRQERTKLPRRR